MLSTLRLVVFMLRGIVASRKLGITDQSKNKAAALGEREVIPKQPRYRQGSLL